MRQVALALGLFLAAALGSVAQAAITANHLTSGSDNADLSVYTSASITPGANRLILAWFINRDDDAVSTVTASGNGLNWVQVATQTYNTVGTPSRRITLFRAMGATPAAGSVTFTLSASQKDVAWSIVEFDGVDTSGTDGSGAIVQSAIDARDSNPTANFAITLATAIGTGNATAGGFTTSVSPPEISPGTGYTAFPETGAGSSLRAEWRSDGNTTVDVNFTDLSRSVAGIAVEIKIATEADIEVTKSVDDATPAEGDTIEYTIALDNNGPDATSNVAVTDLLPSGVSYVSNTPSTGSYASGTGVWTVGSMANGASETLTITATVDTGTAASTIINTASVSASDATDPTPGNDSDTANITVESVLISGTVFEDVNYGGGPGRDLATSAADAPTFTVGRSGATVELYSASGNFLGSTTTAAGGSYSFAGLSPASYIVRVVNDTVTSSRPGSDGSELGTQTYRTDGASEDAGDGARKVGGELPSNEDAAVNSGAQTLGSLQGTDLDTDGVTEWTQSIVTVDTSAGNVTGVDFGFNFDVVVNTNNAGQGSLRQFIINSNLLN